MPKTPSPSLTGTETLAYCTTCKMDLAGLIVAMKGDRILKVECKTCKKTHAYKAPKGITDPSQVVKKAPKRKSSKSGGEGGKVSIEAEWTKLMAAHSGSPAKSYNTKTKFLLGDRIQHPSFGEGIVGRLIYPNKVEVVFRTDLKVLIHGGH